MSNAGDNSPLATNQTSQRGLPPYYALERAVRQFRARFDPEAIDRRGRVLFLLLDHLLQNLKDPDLRNAAAAGDATRFEELAYEAWVAEERGGQQDRAIQELDLQRLFGYWRRAVEEKKPGPQPRKHRKGPDQTFRIRNTEKHPLTTLTAITIHEEIEQIYQEIEEFNKRGPMTVTISIAFTSRDGDSRDGDGNLEKIPFITAAAHISGLPFTSDPDDDRVLLPDRSLHRVLNDGSRALAAAFRAYPKPIYVWNQDPACEVRVRRRRPFYRRRALMTAASLCLVLLLAAGCELAIRRASGLVRRDLYGITSGASIATVCPDGKLTNLIAWNRPLPDWRVVHIELLRNGKPRARVDGLKEFIDTEGLMAGAQYTYNFRVVDFLGRVLQEEDNKIGAYGQCPGSSNSYASPWTISPTEGTWATPFTFTIRPPVVDGEPRSYSWSWGGSKLDPTTNTLYQQRTTPEPSPLLTHRFTPCDDCPQGESDPNGIRLLHCRMTVDVSFRDGRVIRYWSPPVQVRDTPSMECHTTGPVVVSSRAAAGAR